MVFPRIPVCIYFFAVKGLRIICTKNNKSALKGHKSCILATFSSSTDDVKVCKQPSAFTFFFSTKMPVWKFWTKRHAFEPSAGLVEMVRFQSSSVIVLLHHVHRAHRAAGGTTLCSSVSVRINLEFISLKVIKRRRTYCLLLILI